MKLNYKRTVLIGLAFLSICAFWQMYDSIIPLILQNTFGIGETLTGAIMAADNVLAIFLLPLFGALSDKADTRFGKRMPFIVTGTVLAVIFLLLLPIADRKVNMVLFIVSLFALLVSMGLYRSPAVALMPDLTPNKLRSKGNAIINLMGAVGGVYTLIMIKLLVGKGERPDYMPLFVSVAALMAVSVGILAITISEKRIKEKVAEEIRTYEDSTGVKVETEDTIEAEEAAKDACRSKAQHGIPACFHFPVVYSLQCSNDRFFPLYEGGMALGRRRICRLSDGGNDSCYFELCSYWKSGRKDWQKEDDFGGNRTDERLLFCSNFCQSVSCTD